MKTDNLGRVILFKLYCRERCKNSDITNFMSMTVKICEKIKKIELLK